MGGKQRDVPVRRVESDEIRRLFNKSGLFERAEQGELKSVLMVDRLVQPEARLPEGTRSQMIWYLGHGGQKLALVHQYLLPDGTIGGSGRPDTKRMILDDEIIYC